MSWPLRRERWFWVALAPLALIHVWAVFDFRWAWIAERGGIKLLGQFVIGDFLAMLAIIYGLYRIKFGKPAEVIEPSIDALPRYNDRDIGI